MREPASARPADPGATRRPPRVTTSRPSAAGAHAGGAGQVSLMSPPTAVMWIWSLDSEPRRQRGGVIVYIGYGARARWAFIWPAEDCRGPGQRLSRAPLPRRTAWCTTIICGPTSARGWGSLYDVTNLLRRPGDQPGVWSAGDRTPPPTSPSAPVRRTVRTACSPGSTGRGVRGHGRRRGGAGRGHHGDHEPGRCRAGQPERPDQLKVEQADDGQLFCTT